MNEKVIDVEIEETSLTNNQIYIDKIEPATIVTNIDEFKLYVQEMSGKYMSLVVTEDAIKAAKDDRAKLNKAIDSIKSVRKQIKEKVEVNIQEVYEILKECESTLKASSNNIDVQIKSFESKQKEEKRLAVMEIVKQWKARARQIGCPEAWLDKFEFTESWTNKSVSMTKIEEEIKNKILVILESYNEWVEQREKDINTIKETIVTLNSSFGLNTPMKDKKYIDLLDKNVAMAQISGLIVQDAESQKKAEENAATQAKQVTTTEVLAKIREEDKKKAEAIQQESEIDSFITQYEMVFTYTFAGAAINVQQFGEKFADLAKEHIVKLKPIEGYLKGIQVFPKGGKQ